MLKLVNTHTVPNNVLPIKPGLALQTHLQSGGSLSMECDDECKKWKNVCHFLSMIALDSDCTNKYETCKSHCYGS